MTGWRILFLLMTLAVTAYADSRPLNGVAAIVNDRIVTYRDVNEYARFGLAQLQPSMFKDRRAYDQAVRKVAEDSTETLVVREMIISDYENVTNKFRFPESIIDEQIEKQIKAKFNDRITMAKRLKAAGKTFEDFRREQREDIIIAVMRQRNISQQIFISPQKIEQYYKTHETNYTLGDRVKLRMIILRKHSSDQGETRQLADEIIRKLDEGVPFEEMSLYSAGSHPGGDWGWAERNQLRRELTEVAFRLKPGEHSSVIDLPDQCFIMKVEEVKLAGLKPLSEVREEIEKELLIEERRRLEKQWIDRLRQRSFIRYF